MPPGKRARARAAAGKLPRFPYFCHLPYELRRDVWGYFCPQLRQQERVWELDLSFNTAYYPKPPGWTLYLMNDKPNEIFIMSLVHRESRQIIKDALPDTLLLYPPSGLLRFNRESDIIALTRTQFGGVSQAALSSFLRSGFATNIHKLSLDTFILKAFSLDITFTFTPAFFTVQILYLTVEDEYCLKPKINWCGVRGTKMLGIDELKQIFCFPTIPKSSGEQQSTPDLLISDMREFLWAVSLAKVFSTQTQASILPMVSWQGNGGLNRLLALGRRH